MKKVIAVILTLAMCLGLAGCGGSVSKEDYNALKSELEEAKKAIEALSASEVSREAAPEATTEPTVEPTTEPAAKSVQDVSSLAPSQQIYQFEAGSGDSLYGSYSFEITNTFDTPVIVDEYSADFYGADGSILGHDSGVNLVSRVISPGQKAYSGNFMAIDTTMYPEDIERMEISLKVKAVSTYSEMLDFENISLLEGNYGLKVTGKAINNTSSDASMVSIVVVSLGENDQLLDVTYVGSISELAKGESGTFEVDLETESLTKDQVKNVFALGYDFYPTLHPEGLPKYDA